MGYLDLEALMRDIVSNMIQEQIANPNSPAAYTKRRLSERGAELNLTASIDYTTRELVKTIRVADPFAEKTIQQNFSDGDPDTETRD